MGNIKRLRSVAHSIGHHGVSFFSYLHPHLGRFCLESNQNVGVVDLKSGVVARPTTKPPKPLRLASAELSRTFSRILGSESWSVEELSSATIEFEFGSSDQPDSCLVRLETNLGKLVESKMDPLGFKKRETQRQAFYIKGISD